MGVQKYRKGLHEHKNSQTNNHRGNVFHWSSAEQSVDPSFFSICIHFLTAPNVIPLSKCFLNTIVKIITGNMNIVVAAAIAGQSSPPSPIIVGIKGGSVCASLKVSKIANAYSFHEKIKQKMAVAAIPVAAWGKMILKKALNLEYPSTRAASSYSFGISSIKPFNNQTERLKLTTVYKIIIPRCVSFKPNFRYIKKMGTAAAMGGNIRVERIKNNRSSFSGILKRENAYAAKVPKNTEKKVAPKPMIREFVNRWKNLDCPVITI